MFDKSNIKTSTRRSLPLASTAAQRVWAFFCLNPDLEFHERDVARRLDLSPAATHGAISTLNADGALLSRRLGRMILHRLNERQPLVRPSKIMAVVVSLAPLIETLRVSTDLIVLFGSCATGTFRSSSDVDLLIVTSHEEAVFATIFEFGRSYPKEVRPVVVSLAQWMDYPEKNPVFFAEVGKGIVLYQSDRYESQL